MTVVIFQNGTPLKMTTKNENKLFFTAWLQGKTVPAQLISPWNVIIYRKKAPQKKPGKALKKRLLSSHPTQAGER